MTIRRKARKHVRLALSLYKQGVVTEQFLRQMAAYSLFLEIQSTLTLKTNSLDAKLRSKIERYTEE